MLSIPSQRLYFSSHGSSILRVFRQPHQTATCTAHIISRRSKSCAHLQIALPRVFTKICPRRTGTSRKDWLQPSDVSFTTACCLPTYRQSSQERGGTPFPAFIRFLWVTSSLPPLTRRLQPGTTEHQLGHAPFPLPFWDHRAPAR